VSRRSTKRSFREAGVTLTLLDHGTHQELRIGDVPILTSALLGTERAFGQIVSPASRRVIVGGLGFGATLAGVLETVGKDARVIVVEKLETVVRLVQGELSHLAHRSLDDARVTLVQRDVAAVIAEERGVDAILLDVDNGPEWGSFRANARLYTRRGLDAARAALRPGAIHAVWSGYPADGFLTRLREARLHPSVVLFEEEGRVQARAYVGTRGGRSST
jgi:hypothetical protein